MKKNKISLNEHLRISRLIKEITTFNFTDICNAYPKSDKSVRLIGKLTNPIIELKSDLEEKLFREHPRFVKELDKEKGYNFSLNFYYGTSEKLDQIEKYMKITVFGDEKQYEEYLLKGETK